MNIQVVALLVQEGSKVLTQLLQMRPPRSATPEAPTPTPITLETSNAEPAASSTLETRDKNKATSIVAGCVPCALGHLGTCTGLLNEAMRFARSDGVASTEVIQRANMCLDELNAMERVDLRPEMIANLPEWEKEIANKALDQSRATRHGLEGLSSIDGLEKTAADMQTARQAIGVSWFKQKIPHMTPDEKTDLKKHAEEHINEIISPGG